MMTTATVPATIARGSVRPGEATSPAWPVKGLDPGWRPLFRAPPQGHEDVPNHEGHEGHVFVTFVVESVVVLFIANVT